MAAMVARALLATVAVLLIAWFGILLYDTRAKDTAGDIVFGAGPSPAELDRAVDRLRDAELLNPDPTPRIDRARFLLLRERPREALAIVNRVVAGEPANLNAWSVVFAAARELDPARAKEARAQILRLNPLAARRLR